MILFNWALDWSIILIVLAVLLYRYGTRNFDRYSKCKVEFLKPVPFLGNLSKTIINQEHFFKSTIRFYNSFPDQRYFGFFDFNNTTVWLRDPSLIKQITIKDFDHFTDHKNFLPDNVDPLFSNGLFALRGQKWKDMRSTLSPAFTSSKMRSMFPLVLECSEQLIEYIQKEVESSNSTGQQFHEFELKELFTRYANDMIATCAFGIKIDSLQDKNNEFFIMGKKITDVSFWFIMKFFAYSCIPKLMKILKIGLMRQEVADFFRHIVKHTMKTREAHNIIRPDMINLLMLAKKGNLVNDDESEHPANNIERVPKRIWTDDELTSQAFGFFLAGFETVSIILSYASYEIATRPDIQKKLTKEIDNVLKTNEKISYETLVKMKYLEMFICETLRFWPPVPGVDRVCVKPYSLPPPNDSVSTNFEINVGESVFLPILSLHKDAKYFPNPEKFDPERFSDENKSSINPFAYLPFGAGPRTCIGSRLAMMEVKAALFHLLSKFEFVSCSKTGDPRELPMKITSQIPDIGIWIGLKSRQTSAL
ncbi:cytochrome P450 9e2-like [Arctopsyche grandis]|uniref:cytochrome P450 9e2-like n=1 Tax=Arctopsyche grandis TaxID=121162 RepID=UPI00406D69C9